MDLSSRYGAETRYENELGYNMEGRWFTPSNPLPLYGSLAERQQESMMMGSPPPWATMVDMPAGLSLRTTPKHSKTDIYTEMDEISPSFASSRSPCRTHRTSFVIANL